MQSVIVASRGLAAADVGFMVCRNRAARITQYLRSPLQLVAEFPGFAALPNQAAELFLTYWESTAPAASGVGMSALLARQASILERAWVRVERGSSRTPEGRVVPQLFPRRAFVPTFRLEELAFFNRTPQARRTPTIGSEQAHAGPSGNASGALVTRRPMQPSMHPALCEPQNVSPGLRGRPV